MNCTPLLLSHVEALLRSFVMLVAFAIEACKLRVRPFNLLRTFRTALKL